jgi:hypothetical protein
MTTTDASAMEMIVSIAIGVGLAAACGFRVFVPLLVLSIAARAGAVPISAGFEWLTTTAALIAFSIATVLEVIAYYVPWLDNLLDTLATPAAVVAGVIASASVLTDLPPILKWSVAIIAGGGAAGTVQGVTSLLRLKSTATTGGLGNFVLASAELGGSVVTSILAIVLPVVTLVVLIVVVFLIFKLSRRLMGRRVAATRAGTGLPG